MSSDDLYSLLGVEMPWLKDALFSLMLLLLLRASGTRLARRSSVGVQERTSCAVFGMPRSARSSPGEGSLLFVRESSLLCLNGSSDCLPRFRPR